MSTLAIPIERERRWLVTSIDLEMVEKLRQGLKALNRLKFPLGGPTVAAKHEIVQGYFDVQSSNCFRVRIKDGVNASQTKKTGSGESRLEQEVSTDLATTQLFLDQSQYKVIKTRIEIDGWELDLCHGPLEGIIVLEFEAKAGESFPPLPDWIVSAIDVTDSLTNLHLARLAYEIENETSQNVRLSLKPQLPRISPVGIENGRLVEEIAGAFADRVHRGVSIALVNLLLSQIGISDSKDDADAKKRYETLFHRVRHSFEEAVEIQAIAEEKKAIVIDRGFVRNQADDPLNLYLVRSELLFRENQPVVIYGTTWEEKCNSAFSQVAQFLTTL